jgi:type II secretory pathway component PulJ
VRRRAAFTLIEVLAVVALTTIVIAVALRSYVDLSRASTRAAERTREMRHATAVLDRVARDFERVFLVRKPAERDPLEHPWIFLGEARGDGAGADHLKFVTRGHVPRRSAGRDADLEVVAYAVREAEDPAEHEGGKSVELLRWSSPHLPEGLDREIPDDEDSGAVLLADGLAGFAVTFLDEAGESVPSWDSSSVVQSGELPVAVEIQVALANRDDPEAEPTTLKRRVILPLRPVDLEELFDPRSALGGGSGEEEDDEEGEEEGEGDDEAACSTGPCAGLTVCQAINCNVDLGPSFAELMSEIGSDSFCRWRTRIPRSLRSAVRNPACR